MYGLIVTRGDDDREQSSPTFARIEYFAYSQPKTWLDSVLDTSRKVLGWPKCVVSCVLAPEEQSLPHIRFAALSAINMDNNYIIKFNDSVR